MKILLISDSHNRHRELNKLPVADVVVHCGESFSFQPGVYEYRRGSLKRMAPMAKSPITSG